MFYDSKFSKRKSQPCFMGYNAFLDLFKIRQASPTSIELHGALAKHDELQSTSPYSTEFQRHPPSCAELRPIRQAQLGADELRYAPQNSD